MKRVISAILCISLILTFIVPVTAASEKIPITCGDVTVDWMARQVLKEINPTGSDRDRIRAVYDWIIHNCDRYEDGHKAQYTEDELIAGSEALYAEYEAMLERGEILIRDPYMSIPEDELMTLSDAQYDSNWVMAAWAGDMLMYRFGHCGNYSALLTVLLGLMGYESHMIDGFFLNRDGSKPMHKWTYVMIDGKYYWLDVRMDHATYTRTGSIDYRYFLVESTVEWARTHEWDHAYSDALDAHRFGQTQGLHAYGTHFWDTVKHWARGYIEKCYENGYFSGVSDNTFEPNGVMTRGMLVTVMYRLEGQAEAFSPTFTDVEENKWYTSPIGWAQQHGIVTGVTESEFKPNDSVTREQTAAILYRYAELVGCDMTAKGDTAQFSDADKISEYAKDAFTWAIGLKIINGKGEGVLDPKGTATRAELAKILTVFDELFPERTPIQSDDSVETPPDEF